jgi:hypothetical protein
MTTIFNVEDIVTFPWGKVNFGDKVILTGNVVIHCYYDSSVNRTETNYNTVNQQEKAALFNHLEFQVCFEPKKD